MSSNISVSVIVVTCNRPRKLMRCLRSFKDSDLVNFETIVVDQGNEKLSKKYINSLGLDRLLYFRQNKKGLSAGRNFAVRQAKGDLLCFIDDDCIADEKWLYYIYSIFSLNSDIVGVFGSTKPYRVDLNKNKVCPCVFTTKKDVIITKPCTHYKNIGFGNNMSFRKEVFKKYGLFKEWLGIGSIGLSAEDAEFALRLLTYNQRIAVTNKAIVYHDKWLSGVKIQNQSRLYLCGEFSCYGYFALKGYKFGANVLIHDLKDIIWKIGKSLGDTIFFKKQSINRLAVVLIDLLYIFRGLIIALFFSIVDGFKKVNFPVLDD